MLKRLVHPNAVYSIKLGNRCAAGTYLEAVWGFFSAYALVFIISMLAIIATGVMISRPLLRSLRR